MKIRIKKIKNVDERLVRFAGDECEDGIAIWSAWAELPRAGHQYAVELDFDDTVTVEPVDTHTAKIESAVEGSSLVGRLNRVDDDGVWTIDVSGDVVLVNVGQQHPIVEVGKWLIAHSSLPVRLSPYNLPGISGEPV